MCAGLVSWPEINSTSSREDWKIKIGRLVLVNQNIEKGTPEKKTGNPKEKEREKVFIENLKR